MKQQLKVFSPTYGQLTRSIVRSEFGLLTILRMCRFCTRNFALQGINFIQFSIHRILRFKGIRTHSDLHCETCPRCPQGICIPSLDPKLLLKCNKPGHDQDIYRLQTTKGTIHAQAQVIKCTTLYNTSTGLA